MITQPPLHQTLTKIISLTVRRRLDNPASAESWAKGLWIAVGLAKVGPYLTNDRGTQDEGATVKVLGKGFL